jgi:uncharacterized membrane protein YcaP (DUF421 family)
METVLKAVAVYAIILVLTRLSGRRTLSQATPFDVVLLFLIANSAQTALLGPDGSLTNAALIIGTLVLVNVILTYLKLKIPFLSLLIEGAPTVLIHEGQSRHTAMQRARISAADILEAARLSQGMSHLDQIRFAVLETSGAISIIPFPPDSPARV